MANWRVEMGKVGGAEEGALNASLYEFWPVNSVNDNIM